MLPSLVDMLSPLRIGLVDPPQSAAAHFSRPSSIETEEAAPLVQINVVEVEPDTLLALPDSLHALSWAKGASGGDLPCVVAGFREGFDHAGTEPERTALIDHDMVARHGTEVRLTAILA
jgi:hypothetical protein